MVFLWMVLMYFLGFIICFVWTRPDKHYNDGYEDGYVKAKKKYSDWKFGYEVGWHDGSHWTKKCQKMEEGMILNE